MKNILITGGAGFIGSEIVCRLFESGEWNITVLDSMSSQIHGENWKDSYLYNKIINKCNFILGDVRDYSVVKEVVEKQDYIIHLAAETGTGQSMYQINQYNEVNIMGTSNLLQAISLLGDRSCVKKILLASSRSVYGEGRYLCDTCGEVYPNSRDVSRMKNGDFDMYCPKCDRRVKVVKTQEDSEIQPKSLYAYTKFAQEKMLETMCGALGIEYTIFRFQNVYGVGQSLKNPYTGILSIFSTLMLENKDVNIFEDGLETRDFVNVKDISAGVVTALVEEKCNGEIINLGSGIATSVMEIAEILRTHYNSKSKLIVTGDFRKGDIANNMADISKAEALIGFKPTVNLQDGLKEFCEWVLLQDRDNSGYEKSLVEMERAGMFIRK